MAAGKFPRESVANSIIRGGEMKASLSLFSPLDSLLFVCRRHRPLTFIFPFRSSSRYIKARESKVLVHFQMFSIPPPAVFVLKAHLSITHCCDGERAKEVFMMILSAAWSMGVWCAYIKRLWWYSWGNACSCIKLHNLYGFIFTSSKHVWPINIYERSCKYCIWKMSVLFFTKIQTFKIRDSGALSVLF